MENFGKNAEKRPITRRFREDREKKKKTGAVEQAAVCRLGKRQMLRRSTKVKNKRNRGRKLAVGEAAKNWP